MILSGESKYVDGKKRYCPDVYTDGVIVRTTDGETMSLTAVLNGMEGRLDAGAEKLATPRTITVTGRATGSMTFDGSEDVTLNITGLDLSGLQYAQMTDVTSTNKVASPAYVAAQLAPINTSLAGKAEQAAMNTALAGKADVSALEAVGAKISTLASDTNPALSDLEVTDKLNKTQANHVTPATAAEQMAGRADVFKDLATLQAATMFKQAGDDYVVKKTDYAEVLNGDTGLLDVYHVTSKNGDTPVWAYLWTMPNTPLTAAQQAWLNLVAGLGLAIANGALTVDLAAICGTGLIVSDAGTLTVDFAAQDDKTSTDKAVSPAYVASALAGFTGGVDEAAVRAIVTDALDNYDFTINDTVVLNAVNKVLAGTDVGQINQRLDTLEAAFNVGGSSSTPYPGVSAIITMEVPDDDFFLVSGIHDRVNKMLKI